MIEIDSLRKSIILLNRIFKVLISADIVVCFLTGSYDYMLSSVILITGLLLAGAIIKHEKYDYGTLFISFTFYIVGFYHVIVLDNYTTCYFILTLVPVVCILLIEKFYFKILLIVASSLLFPLCNYFAGLRIYDNYFFYYGLIPSSYLMIHYYNKLEQLTLTNNKILEELREKNKEIVLFSNMMSHDLKAPLRNIEGFSSLLKKKLKNLDANERELFSFIITGVKSMKKLIDDLLLYSKSSINDYALESFDFDELIESLLQSFNYDIANSNVEINKGKLGMLYGHKDSISLVFQNLISNAIKFQPKEETHIPKISISQINDSSLSQIIVSDNGIGIDTAYVKEMFLPFKRLHSTSQYEGTGLGMSIVKKVIDKHQGTIEVTSKLGQGCKFVISLPAK